MTSSASARPEDERGDGSSDSGFGIFIGAAIDRGGQDMAPVLAGRPSPAGALDRRPGKRQRPETRLRYRPVLIRVHSRFISRWVAAS